MSHNSPTLLLHNTFNSQDLTALRKIKPVIFSNYRAKNDITPFSQTRSYSYYLSVSREPFINHKGLNGFKGFNALAASTPETNLTLISGRIKPILDSVKNQLMLGQLQNLPVLGTIDTKNYVTALLNDVDNRIIAEINKQSTKTVTTFRQALFNALGTGGLNLLLDANGDKKISLDDISIPQNNAEAIAFQFKLGKSFTPNFTLASQLGLPTLGLDIKGGVSGKFDFSLSVGFGVDKNANVFLDTKTAGELQAQLQVNLVDGSKKPLQGKGKLGFLNLQATDNGSQLTANFSADLISASADGLGRLKVSDLGTLKLAPNPKLTANADLKFKLDTGLGATKNDFLPSIGADLNLLGWRYDSSNLGTAAPSLSLDNITLDVGSFARDFVGGVLKPVQDVFQPIGSVLAPFRKPLPVIGRSIVDLAASAGAIPSETRKFLDILDTIGSLALPGDNGKINFGSFRIAGGDVRTTKLGDLSPSQSAARSTVASVSAAGLKPNFLKNLEDSGFGFPLFDQPTNIAGLLMGKQGVNLITYKSPRFFIKGGVDLPKIPIFGPIFLGIGGEVEAGAQIELGYDTTGIGNGNFSNGFFVKRTNADVKNPESRKQSNLYAGGLVKATAEASIGIVSFGIGGALDLGVGLNFRKDSNGEEQKVRFIEGQPFVNKLPFCAFETGGSLSLIIFGQMELNLGFFSVTKRLDLANIALLDFQTEPDCTKANYFDRPDPKPTPQQEGVLKEQGIITRSGTDTPDTITVVYKGGTWSSKRADSTESIEILGIPPTAERHDKVTLIVISGGEGNDTISFINGVRSPGQIKGGNGNDSITTGLGNDFLNGGRGNDTLDGGAGNNTADYVDAPGGINVNLATGITSNDGYGTQDILKNIRNVQGSAFNDVMVGDAQSNHFDGGRGDDFLNGGDGDDVLLGAEGRDTLIGGNGNDTTTYIDSSSAVFINLSNLNLAGRVTLPDGSSLSPGQAKGGPAEGDSISGVENVSGSAYGDILVGGSGGGIIDGWLGDDTIYAGSGAENLIGSEGIDWLSYKLSTAGVNANLKANFFSGGFATADRVQKVLFKEGSPSKLENGNSFENLEGSIFDDFTLAADDNNNIIKGLSGNDRLFGAGGDDLLIGGAGADFHDGGGGVDTVSYIESWSAVSVNLFSNQGFFAEAAGDTFSGVENLLGSNFNDTLIGNGVNNVINPALSGGNIDVVDGGGGVDTLVVDYSLRDFGGGVRGGFNTSNLARPDNNNIKVLDQVSFSNIENLNVTGTTKDDAIVGGAGNDTVSTGAGNDFIDGGSGVDVLKGGPGIDTLSKNFSNENIDIYLTSFAIDRPNPYQIMLLPSGGEIRGFEIFRDITTGSGNDTLIQADRVNNNFSTGFGNDVVNAGLGFDTVDGGSFGLFFGDTDTLIIDYSARDTGGAMVMSIQPRDKRGNAFRLNLLSFQNLDRIDFTNFENYQVTGTTKDDSITTGDGADQILGGDGNDLLKGNRGNDNLGGGAGNDTLVGTNQINYANLFPNNFPRDNDILSGGDGADRFVLGARDNGDLGPYYANDDDNLSYALISDFNPSQGDVIQLYGFASDYSIVNRSGVSYIYWKFTSYNLIATVFASQNLDTSGTYFAYLGRDIIR